MSVCNGVSYSPFSLEDEDPVGISEAASSDSLPEGLGRAATEAGLGRWSRCPVCPGLLLHFAFSCTEISLL